MTFRAALVTAAALTALLAACRDDPTGPTSADTATSATSPTPTDSPDLTLPPSPSATAAEPITPGSGVRFRAGTAELIIRAADNPTSDDFISMLPLTLTFEDFAGREKISYLPRELTTEGATGRAPANDDLVDTGVLVNENAPGDRSSSAPTPGAARQPVRELPIQLPIQGA